MRSRCRFHPVAIALLLPILFLSCKSSTTPSNAVKVNLTFHYRNATEGEIFQKSMANVDAGTQITLNVSDVAGYPNSNVDPLRITVRDSINSIGSFVAHSSSGSVTFAAGYASKDYGVYLYSLSDGADYAVVDQDHFRTAGSQIIFSTRKITVHREDRDGQVCPDGVWFGSIGGYTGALDQLNNALHGIFGFNWGSITLVASNGWFGAGAGSVDGYDGEHLTNWIGVNYNKLGYNPMGLVSTALEEGHEIITDTDDLGGNTSKTVLSYGQLLPVGRDYLLYTFIKDKLGDV